MSQPLLHIATYNIHKGFSQFNRRMMVHELRERLHSLNPDIIFLQEVQGLHLGHAEKHADWPGRPQHEFLADDIWESAYGRNMIYDHGHHGNAILSRFPILHAHNQDVTHLQFEKRGLLHCRIALPEGPAALRLPDTPCNQRRRATRRQEARLLADIQDNLPVIVQALYNFWRAKRGGMTVQREEPKSGRNDPCPCGSGKKYKQCCGRPEKLN